jgi:hypothetical protein
MRSWSLAKRGCRSPKTPVVMLAVSVVRLCHAAGIAGTWHFDKAMDFDFPTRKIQTVAPPYIQATSSQLFIPPACAIKLEKTAYYPGGPFQSMLKEGDEEAAIGKFLLGEFSICQDPGRHAPVS